MFENARVSAYAPVSDLDRGRDFYEGKLGLKPKFTIEDVGVSYECAGKTDFFMYVSEYAGTNKASALFFTVDDVQKVVDQLREVGIQPIDYDAKDIKTVNGIMEMGESKGAWIKDPDGNIIAIIEG